VVSIFTRRVLGDMPPIIYGDGRQTRDYTYVTDAVQAYDCVLKHKEPIVEPVNFGSSSEVSILDLANMVIEMCGKQGSLQPINIEPRMGEVQRLIADATRARELLGWKTKYSFEAGLKEFISWYRNYGFEERIKFE